MRTSIPAGRVRPRPLVVSAVVAATLGLGADQAAAAYTAQLDDGTLTLSGNGASDRLVLRLRAGDPNTLEADVGADGGADLSFDRSTFTALAVLAGGGADEVRIDHDHGAFPDEAVTLDGGSGADTLTGGVGDQTLAGGSGNDSVSGGDGDDTALLGAGNDRFAWNPGDDNDTVEGEAGADALDFNGSSASETIDVSADGSRVRLLRDIASIDMDLGGVERIEVGAFAGNDTIVAGHLAGTDAETVAIDLAAFGGAGDGVADSVIVGATAEADVVDVGSEAGAVVVSGAAADVRVSGGEAHDEVNLGTGDGDDTINAGVELTGAAVIDVDGGAGTDTAVYRGTAAADAISANGNGGEVRTAGPASAPFDTLVEDLHVLGLGGDDTISSLGNTLSHRLTFDGGAGADDLRGSAGPDVLLGGSGNDLVDGNFNADVASLGAGADRFQWDPGDGSDTVEGESGTDVLAFNGSNIGEVLDVSANGERVRFTRNVANIVLDVDDVEGLAVRALGGADTMTVDDLAGTDLRTADVDLSAFTPGPDAEADVVYANGTAGDDAVRVSRTGAQARVRGLAAETRVTGSETLDSLRVQTLGGDDEVTIASNLSDLIGLIVDLGADD